MELVSYEIGQQAGVLADGRIMCKHLNKFSFKKD
jgi:hypothetical protein